MASSTARYQQTILVWVSVCLSIALHTGAYPSTSCYMYSCLSQCNSGAEAELVYQLKLRIQQPGLRLLSSFMGQCQFKIRSRTQTCLITTVNSAVDRSKTLFKSSLVSLHLNSPLFFPNSFDLGNENVKRSPKFFLFICLRTTFTGFILGCRVFLGVVSQAEACFCNI